MAISIKIKSKFCFSYSEHLNKVPFIDEIIVKNTGKEEMEATKLVLYSEPCFFKQYECEIPKLSVGGVFTISRLNLDCDAEVLAEYSEAIEGRLCYQLLSGENVLYKNEAKVDLRPYDEGSNYMEDAPLRAAFVTPNHPEITALVTKISNRKGERKGSYSIVGYQWDEKEVFKTAECMFDVVKEEEIAYVLSKRGFNSGYQRIRLVDEILAKKQANCMDMTYLFASLLEALGLNPLIVIAEGHAFVGFWLADKTFTQPVRKEKDLLRKVTALGSRKIMIFECTHATKGKDYSFAQACETALERINTNENYVSHIVDVKRARQGGINPLPARISGSKMQLVRDVESGNVSKIHFEYPDILDEDDENLEPVVALNKIQRWKNKLLDLSASSALLNLKITSTGKGAAYILSTQAYALYKMIKSGQAFSLEGQPEDFEKTKRSADLFEMAAGVYSCKNIVESNMQQNILHLSYEATTAKKLLSAMRSADRNHREQNGAGILYMTFGSLRWADVKTGKNFYAPILLVPVVFEKIGKNFQLVYEGTEIFLNAAILEMLKIRFDLRPTGLNPLPMEADGKPDLAAIIKSLRKACQNQEGLEVFEHVCIGLFAFSQYLMWNDLDKHEEFFLKHPIIKSIVDGEPLVKVNEGTQEFDEADVMLPMPADGSQIKAIQSALGNQSLVLHGPPGTGKSQTITVLLANYLAYDRSVLFSAEKAAALQVVYNRMKAIHLEDFCLYLPADATKKSDTERFLAQYASLMEKAQDSSTNYEKLKLEIAKEKEKLTKQLEIFKITGAKGFSLENLLNASLKNKEKWSTKTITNPMLMQSIENGDYDELARLLKEAMHMGNLVGGVKDHPLKNWKNFRYEYGIQQTIRENSEAYLELLKQIHEIDTKLPKEVPADVAKKYYLAGDVSSRYRAISHLDVVPEEIRQVDNIVKLLKDWIAFSEVSEVRDKFYLTVKPEFLDLDLKRYKVRWDMLRNRMGTRERLERLNIKIELLEYMEKKDATDKDISDILEEALKIQEINKKVPLYLGYEFEIPLSEAKAMLSRILTYYPTGIPEIIKSCTEEERELAAQGLELLAKHEAMCRTLRQSLGNDAPLWNQKSSIDEAVQNVERWGAAMDTIREWSDYQMLRADCEKQRLTPWIVLYESGMDSEKVLQDFEAVCNESMLRKVYETYDEIRKFAGYRFEHLVEHYEELMKEYYTVCAKEIRCRMLQRIAKILADPANGANKIALKKLIESAGKGNSIRSIINRLGAFLLDMTPCVMATPMTTAMYFAPETYTFDHMVLDEASQLQTCKSVGLIARSRSAIVVGDPNQMPPTAFFESAALDETIDVLEEDQESILKDFIALDMPDYYLKWHYRSNHESLIAYSNQNYYGQRMITFPSRDNENSRVRIIRTNGIYDRGHSTTNKVEAETLVEYLVDKLAEGDTRSYGIIAFNKRQQMLIERIIEKRCDSDETFANALDVMEERGESIFVRNLESVQGDERDVILFTVGFGPDEDGKIIMTFGPLARAGGWRRLNVAITRARDEMVLFTSMDSNQMPITASTSRGVRDLKNFIAYAENKLNICENSDNTSDADHEDEKISATDGFADSVCAYLDELGYTYKRNLGASSLKMDIAVESPDKKGDYVLGILLNSKAISGKFSIYDSEVGQPNVLRGHGWKLLRLWSLDWLEDANREKKRIKGMLE